jgi:hypothetical protein
VIPDPVSGRVLRAVALWCFALGSAMALFDLAHVR